MPRRLSPIRGRGSPLCSDLGLLFLAIGAELASSGLPCELGERDRRTLWDKGAECQHKW